MKTILSALAIWACAASAMAASLPATPTTIAAVVKAAQPGDSITLGAGDYPQFSVTKKQGLSFDAATANLSGVVISGSSAITWAGGTFRPLPGYVGAIYVTGSQGVHLSKITDLDVGNGNGVTFRASSDVSLENSLIQGAKIGVAIGSPPNSGVNGFVVRGVTFVGQRSDGIDIADSHNGLVEYNICTASNLIPGVHPDCIQGWSVAGSTPQSDIIIRNNVAWGYMQGISFFDHAVGGFDRITIQDNLVATGYPNGISLYAARDSVVRGNRVLTLPGSTFPTKMNVVDGVRAIVCGNSRGAGGITPFKAASADAACTN